MLAGDLYYAFGEELTNERQHAKKLIFKYNNQLATSLEGRAVGDCFVHLFVLQQGTSSTNGSSETIGSSNLHHSC